MIRNSINVIGITPENKLPNKIIGQIIEYSETETIFITEGKHKIRNISQIEFKIKLTSNRVITAPLGKVVVLDGIKKFRLKCSKKDSSKIESTVELETPYNAFFELPQVTTQYSHAEVYILDAYFQLINSNKLYSHIIYLINVIYSDKSF